MSTVYFNDKLRRNLNQALFTRQYGASATENDQYGFRTAYYYAILYGVVNLMKGAVPTDFTELTSPSSRSSDILVTWTTNQGGWSYSDPLTNIDGIANVSSPYSVASASGIATWFWWYNATGPAAGDPAYRNYIYTQLVGTVGTSGTDLVIADTTIIAGANYRLLNLKFDVPTEYTY